MKEKKRTKPNIFIMVDMEGISGISQLSQIRRDEMHYATGCKYLTWDVNACVEGCFTGDAGRVVVRDAHGRGFNLLWDQLDGRVECIQGNSPRRMPNIADFDGLILLGYHTMAGTPRGVLEHTWSGTWQNFWINGTQCGELLLEAGIAGDNGVPVIMVSGDDKTCAEARDFLKDVVAVEVKKALDFQGAQLLPKDLAHQRIRQGAEKAVRSCRKLKPYRVAKPVRMRLELIERERIPVNRAGVKVIDGRTYEVTADTVEEALNQL